MTPAEQQAIAMANYYARRAGFFEGALMVISLGAVDGDLKGAAKRALEGAGEDEYARRLKAAKKQEG